MKWFRRSVWRSCLLGFLALVAICYGLIELLDVSPDRVWALLGASVILVLALAVSGLVGGYLLNRLSAAGSHRAIDSTADTKNRNSTKQVD